MSLQVPEEQVLNAALREKLALLPPQARAPPPKVRHLGCLPYRSPLPAPKCQRLSSPCLCSNRSHLAQGQT